MRSAFRRVILKPAGLGENDLTRLREALSAAVLRQRQLAARSPHVLHFCGGLQESADAFYVDHEEASPIAADSWFDPAQPPMPEPELLRWTAALFDALRTAHQREGARAIVHGALCPGTLLVTPDGVEKVSDFGFGPAMCSVFGPERFINLAVAAAHPLAQSYEATGVWETLHPETFDRDDRICAFVDPEKYGTKALDSFEPCADVIAAAFLLHLAAEHRHAYLYAEPDAHRLVELCEYMGMGRYNHARRKDLRESTEPGIQLWCDQIAKALARLPQHRPSAGQILEALKPHARPVEATEVLGRRLEAVERSARTGAADQVPWEDVCVEAAALAESEISPPEIKGRAEGLLREAKAHRLIRESEGLLLGDRWKEARAPLEAARALEGLPPAMQTRMQAAFAALERDDSLDRRLNEVEARLGGDQGADPAQSQSLAAALLKSLEAEPPGDGVPPSLHDRRVALLEKVAGRLAWAKAEVERIRAAKEADRIKAEAWLAQIHESWEAKQGELLQELLAKPPELKYWPAGIREAAGEIRHRLADHLSAHHWMESVRHQVRSEAWSQAQKLLGERPSLTYWPAELNEEARELEDRVRFVLKKQADHRQAAEWYAGVERAFARLDWPAAGAALAGRPDLEHWPEDVLEKEATQRPIIEQALEALERERRRIEEEHRRARTWLGRAKAAARANQWEDVQTVLSGKPQLTAWPSGVLAEAEELERTCVLKLSEDILRNLEARTRAVHALAEEFVRGVVENQLGAVLHPRWVHTTIDAEEFTSQRTDADGRARLLVRVSETVSPTEHSDITSEFDFQVGRSPHRICDNEDRLRSFIAKELSGLLANIQKTQAANLAERIRRGLFPQALLRMPLDRLADKLPARVDFLGKDVPDAGFETQVLWDREALSWSLADMAAFNQRGVEIACKATRKAAAARILERSEELRRYKAFLSLEVRCPSPPGPGPLPFSLPLEGQLRIQWGGKGEPQRLQSFAFTCSEVGKVAADLDLSDARENLRRILVNGQRESSDLLVQNLQARLKAAPVKTRLTVEPKRIKEPSDQIKLGLELKTGGMLALAGTWDVESLTYRLPDDAQERLAEFLKPPAPPPPPPPPKPKPPQKAKAEKPVKAPIERAPRKGGRRGTAVGAAVVVIAAVAVGLLFRGQPPPGKPASIAPALDKVKALLGVSAHLGPFVGELIDTNGTVSSDARDITVQLPGLAESVQTVALTRAETPQGDIWRLADGQAERLRERVAGLDALLDVGGLEFEPSSPSTVRIDRLAAMLSSISADGALKRGRVTARLPDDLEWNLSAQQNAWTTSPVELTLGFQPEGQAAVENGNRVELARVPVALQATNGSVTADFHADDALAALERQIRDRLAKPPPSIEPAVEELKAMLRASAHLDSIVDQLIESGEPADGRPPTLAYRLPGLAQSRQAVELEVEASGERDLWHMAEGQAERVRQRVADLDALLDVAVIEAATEEVLGDVLDKPGLAGLIRPSQVSIRIIESADWQPKLQHDSWETRSVTANVVFRLSAGAPPEANISLAHLTAVWVAESGTVTVAGEAADLEAELARQIQQSLTDRRRALAQDLSAQLTEEAALAQAQLAGPVASSTQPANLEYSAACPMLQPRTLTATWDPATLRFDATAAQRELADLRTAVAVLQELNKPKPADHWLTQGSKDSLIEVAAPREGTWVLGAIAPWSAAGDYATAPATDRLHLSVDWDSVAKPQDPGQAAHALLSAGLVRPEYWPLIEEYQRYAGQPSPEWSSALLRTLAAGLDPQSAERLNELLTNQGSVRVGLKLDGPPVATATSEGEPESLELRFSGKLTLAQNGPQLPPGTDVAELSGRIEKVFAESFTITLSVVDGDVKTASKDAARWMAALARSVDTAKDIVEAVFVAQRERERQLAEQQLKDQQLREQQLREQQLREQQLREQKQREQQPPPEEKIPPAGGDVKRQLDAALSGRASADLDQGTAFELLKGIWAGKGTTPPPGVADLLSLSQALRRIYSGENQPDPTIFIECFCSADNAYAVVWSASWGQSRLGGGAGIKEGPKLLRSDARGNPSAALTAILEAVPLASNAKASFGFVLGVVVGSTNDCLPGIMNAPLNRHSQLEAGVPDTPWTSLSELNELHRRKRLRCAAWIRPSLGGS